jgi:hypothetical protein
MKQLNTFSAKIAPNRIPHLIASMAELSVFLKMAKDFHQFVNVVLVIF